MQILDVFADRYREKAEGYLQAMSVGAVGARLAADAEASLFALCFRVFLSHLLLRHDLLSVQETSAKLRDSLRKIRAEHALMPVSKPYRQILTFSLSALAVMGTLSDDPLEDLVAEQLAGPLHSELEQGGCLEGRAGSGNQAMFLAIFMIHGREYLGRTTQPMIDQWLELHLRRMNRFGFWGEHAGMTHLQFQNGFHQHEILEYLGKANPRLAETLPAVRGLADAEGHFAPYPGGGGCYDYDAVFMLTPDGRIPDEATRELLCRTAVSIASEQRPDGGFAESIRVRPRSLRNLGKFASHVLAARGNWPLFAERMRYALTLQRPKHDRIHTHWSRYSRRWDESDLWDTWFRMLALARIDVAMNQEHASRWGFIDYPGIGYHPSLRKAHT